MYYEERVIKGVLCWRNSPTGAFVRFTQEELTQRLLEAQDQLVLESTYRILEAGL